MARIKTNPQTPMPSGIPPNPAALRAEKANKELLHKGLMLIFIGLAVLIGPYFMAPGGMRGIVASSSLVGWFGLALGVAFMALYARRRWQAGKSPD
ncbi:hypothetical protein BH11PSE7_BH11PSE7_31750 [soil metagenome]